MLDNFACVICLAISLLDGGRSSYHIIIITQNGVINFELITKKVKVKSSMARSLPVENLLPQKVGSIINYFQ